MIDLSRVEKYYVACGYTDMRRGIDGLAATVSQQFGAPLCEDSLFPNLFIKNIRKEQTDVDIA